MFLEVKEIKFDNHGEASDNKNYLESGFYIVEIGESGMADLRFIDKSTMLNILICPKSVYDGLQFMAVNPNHHKSPEVLTSLDVSPPEGYVSETFILDFTKTLLTHVNKK